MRYPQNLYGLFGAFALLLIVSFSSNFHSFLTQNSRSQLAAIDGAGSNLIAYYPFEDTSGADWSGSGYQGTVAAASLGQGKVGSGSMVFNGSNSQLASGRINLATNEITVAFWYNVTKNGTLMGLGHGLYCAIIGASQINCSADGDSSGSATFTPSSSGWHHVVYTSTASSQTLYVDGASVRTTAETYGPSSEYLFIGNEQGGTATDAFGGSIDDFRIYDRALTAGEVTQLFAQTQNSPQVQGSVPPPPVNNPPVNNPPPSGGGTCATTDSSILAPSNLRITETPFNGFPRIQIYLRWNDNASNESGYIVEQSLNGGSFSTLDTLGANSTLDFPNLVPTDYYSFRVKAYVGSNCSNPSEVLSNLTGMSAPAYFDVVTEKTNEVTIYFGDRSGLSTSYRIDRSTDGINYTNIVNQPLQSPTYVTVPGDPHQTGNLYKYYIDTTVTPGSTYYYRVAPFNTLNNGQAHGPYATPDERATALPYIMITPGGPPATPGITASVAAGNGVRISITDNSNNESTFEIQRSVDGGAYASLCTFNAGTADKYCTDSGVTAGKTYTYRVRARVAGGTDSAWATASPITIGATGATTNTEWYVWSGATGNGSGDSWTNAWTDIDRIAWSSIKPGDTIYISGGTYSQGLTVFASGVQANPVKIKTGAVAPVSAGHNGRVFIKGIDFKGKWITVDGGLNPNYVPATALDNDPNINMEIAGTVGDGVSATGAWGLVLRFLKITNVSAPSGKTAAAIHYRGSSTDLDFNEMYGLHISYIANEGIYLDSRGARLAYDTLKVSKTLLEYIGDDGMLIGGTATISDCVIRYGNPFTSGGHPDGIQTLNTNYLDVHNTQIYDRDHSSYMIISESAAEGGSIDHIRIYNNLFYYTDPNLAPITEGVIFLASSNFNFVGGVQTHVSSQTWNDILVANNTFYNLRKTTPIKLLVHTDEVGRVTATNVTIKNNIILDSAASGGSALDVSNALTTDNTLKVENNIVAGLNKNIGWKGTTYSTGEAFSSATGFVGNKSTTPTFVNIGASNFHLASTDTVARNQGANLSSFFTNDLDNTTRSSSGAWDIGAYGAGGGAVQQPPPNQPPSVPGLMLNLNFDSDDFVTKRSDQYSTIAFADQSGQGNTADCQSGFSMNGSTFNQCPTSTAGPAGGKAANFAGGAICDMAADYVAVPGTNGLNNLTQGTIAFYALHANSATDNRLLDAFTANAAGTWGVQWDGDPYVTMTANSDIGSENDWFTFPTSSVGAWDHYAFTWDGLVFKGYFNGTYFGDYSMQGLSKLNIGGYLVLGALKHNYPRNNTSATPNCYHYVNNDVSNGLTYVFPNAGFFSGKMDDIRVYNRALSSSEINSLASSIPAANIVYVTRSGTGTGSVSGTGAGGGVGIGCGKHCAEKFSAGATVTLTATPDSNSAFAGWTGSCSGTGTCTVTASGSKTVGAVFTLTYQTIATFPAQSGQNSATFPFAFAPDGSIFSNGNAATINTAKRITYSFNVTTPGDYVVVGNVSAASQSNNSFYANMDTEPVDTPLDVMAWFTTTTAGFEDRFLTRLPPAPNNCCDSGKDTNNNILPPYKFNLTAGPHTLIIKGREDRTYLKTITIQRVTTGVSVPPPQPNATGDLNGDGIINALDLSLMAGSWNKSNAAYDLNHDGIINTLDYVIMVRNWTS